MQANQAGPLELAWKVEDIAKAYNFDHGDPWTDYSHRNFYLTVRVRKRPVTHRDFAAQAEDTQ